MTIPVCPQHPNVALEPVRKGWHCELCERTVLSYEQHPRTEEATPSAAKTDVSGPLRELMARWPSLVALPLRDYIEETHPVLKLWNACDVVEICLRFLVMAGIADLQLGGEIAESVLSQLRDRIELPTLGKWMGMGQAVAAELGAGSAIPELKPYVLETLVPLLQGREKPPTPETSFLKLRNRLAHGGGITKTAAMKLLAHCQPGFEEAMQKGSWLSEFSLLVRSADGTIGELRGPVSRPVPVSPERAKELAGLDPTAQAVFLQRGGTLLKLWPLSLYGETRLPGQWQSGEGEVPQVYLRRGEVGLEYTPLGSESARGSEGDQAGLEAFQNLFRLKEGSLRIRVKRFAVRGWERELGGDSDMLVGRTEEIATLEKLVWESRHGVIWLGGEPGVGKSYVMARLATELLEAPPEGTLILPYRFRLGDDRCSRDAFLRFAAERIEDWVREGSGDQPPAQSREELPPLKRVQGKLEGLSRSQRVVFFLDGLDEIAERDPNFAADIPLSLKGPHIVWFCAGRPERGLPEAFGKAGAVEPYPKGLPRMSGGDIRTMLLEQIGSLRKRLILGDREDGDRIVNAFIDRVCRNADGLPIYVRYVVNDVKQARVIPDPGAPLPGSLGEYHEELLKRCSVGSLHQVLTPLAATLAVAYESLTAEELGALLRRRAVTDTVEGSVKLVVQGLSAIETMIRRAPDPDGGEGYTLYHHSLRQHILTSPSMDEAIRTARRTMAEAALKPEGDDAERYLHRQGVRHLLDRGLRQEALETATNSQKLATRFRALPSDQARKSLAEDWEKWLLPSRDLKELESAAGEFRPQLSQLCSEALESRDRRLLSGLLDALLWQFVPDMEVRIGGHPAFRIALPETVRLANGMVDLEPENTQYLRDLLVSYSRMGDLDERSDPGKARQWYLKGLEIALRLVDLEPENANYRHDLSGSFNKIGDLVERSDPDKARQWYLKGLEIAKRLVELAPENTTCLRDLSVSFNKMGDLDERSDPGKARQWYLKGLEIARRLVDLAPENAQYVRDLSVIYSRMGDLDERSDPGKARQWYLKCLEIAKRLVDLEPENTQYLHDLSLSYSKIGGLDERSDQA